MNALKEKKLPIPKNELLFSNKALWVLIWPLLVETILQNTVGIADVFMVASLGEAAVSGVSLVDSINILFIMIFSALATGGAVVCSQYIGNKNMKKAEETARQLIYTVVLSAFILMTVLMVFHKPLLRITFGSIEDDVMYNARIYFVITLLCFIPLALYDACAALYRAQGNSRISMNVSFLVNGINIAGNALLIYGFKRGVEGVAIPTLVSRIAGAVILMVKLHNQKGGELCIKGLGHIHLDWSLISKILKIGIPTGLENSVFQFGKVVVLSLISSYGTIAIAANAAANTMASLGIIPGQAIGIAMLTVIGQCIGAGRTDQAVYYTKKLMGITYAAMWMINVPFVIFLRDILGFYHLSPETTDLAYFMSIVHVASAMFIWPFSFTLPNSLRAANDAAFTMIVSMISMWTVRVGMSYVFKYTGCLGLLSYLGAASYYGAVGVWVAMIMDWCVRIVCFVVRFAGGKWKTRKLI